MSQLRILLTGPTGSLGEWESAARKAGLAVEIEMVLRLLPKEFELDDPAPDWLLITSAHAMPALGRHREDLAEVPAAVVGEVSARHLRTLGLRVEVGPFPSGRELMGAWRAQLRPGQTVLWPGGSVRGEIGAELREFGVHVIEPLAYSNQPVPGPELPEVDAILFTAPSGVRAARARGWSGRPIGLAMGPSTEECLAEQPGDLCRIERLEEPTAEAFGRWCRSWVRRGR